MTTPTPQAVKAARQIVTTAPASNYEGRLNQAADIIDREMGGWWPIKGAPKDGTSLLLYDSAENVSVVGRWGKHNHIPLYGWIWQIELYGEECDGFDATHFRPLPPPPAI